MKKQTALQWLIEQVHSDEYTHAFGRTYISIDFIEQAKAMEKEQIIDANNIGYSAGKRDTDETAEQYYTSTYGQ